MEDPVFTYDPANKKRKRKKGHWTGLVGSQKFIVKSFDKRKKLIASVNYVVDEKEHTTRCLKCNTLFSKFKWG